MAYTNLELLLIINLLHFLCGGIVIPILSRQIALVGASQFTIGTLHAMVYIVQELTMDVLALFQHGKKYMLTLSMYYLFVCYFFLIFYHDTFSTGLVKCLLGLSTGVITISREYAERTEPPSKHIKIFNTLDLIRIVGNTLGAIVGGYLFEVNQDLVSNVMVAACLTLVCILMTQDMHFDNPGLDKPESNLYSLPIICKEKLTKLSGVNFKEKILKLSSLLLEVAFITSFVMFFSRLAFLLGYNYHTDAISAGFAMALQNFLLFFGNCFVPFARTQSHNLNFLGHSIIFSSLSLIALYYAPTFHCHLFFYVPVFFSYTLTNTLLEERTKSKETDETSRTLGVMINIIFPVVSGLLCDLLGGAGFKMVAILPPCACVAIITYKVLRGRQLVSITNLMKGGDTATEEATAN